MWVRFTEPIQLLLLFFSNYVVSLNIHVIVFLRSNSLVFLVWLVKVKSVTGVSGQSVSLGKVSVLCVYHCKNHATALLTENAHLAMLLMGTWKSMLICSTGDTKSEGHSNLIYTWEFCSQ